jgi:hypothetical protein
MAAYRQAHATCTGHPDVVAARICRKCDQPLCEPCCAYVVNDDIWCASCGGELAGDLRASARARTGFSVFGVVAVVVLMGLVFLKLGRFGITGGLSLVVFLTVTVAQLARARWLRAGPRVFHSPLIHRRQPGDALPRRWAFATTDATPESAAVRAGRPPA